MARDHPIARAERGIAPVTSALMESYRFVALVTAIRWATTALGLILLSTGEPTATDAAIGAAVISYSLCRTLWPLDFAERSKALLLAIAAEGALMVTAVVLTGYWESPFVFGLVVVISAAGFIGGIPLAVIAAIACLVNVAVPYHLRAASPATDVTVRWAGELILVAILAGYVRHLARQATAQTSLFVGQLRQLSDVNELLAKLRDAAESLPVSLDLGDALDLSVRRLRELLEPDVVVILLHQGDQWTVARASGARLGGPMATADLPPVLRRAAEATGTVTLVTLGGTTTGLAGASQSGLYVRLCAREELIGLLAVERGEAEPYGAHHVEIVAALSQQMAFALDNARWFARIGTLATEQERSRIARDLHDRMGQSLALVGFELDRLAKNASNPVARDQIVELRQHVGAVVTELREALYDLRTDVSEDRDLPGALTEFLERVGQRSGLETQLTCTVHHRLALTLEREVWRIAQEAVLNAERHARARSVQVEWVVTKASATLSVVDDGEGLPQGARRSDGYGILGMHERAQAVGASLTLASTPGRGTTVLLTVPTERLALDL